MEWFFAIGLVFCVGRILWLGSRTSKLETRVRTLDHELSLTNTRVHMMAVAEDDSAKTPASGVAPSPRRRRPALAQSQIPATSATPQPVVEEVAPGLAVALAIAADVASKRKPEGPSWAERFMARARTSDEWEALIGGNWLNRVGAIALILGLAFFLKYAFDNNWIKQGAQVGVGIVVGVILLALAHRSYARGYAIFAQGLVGAGLAILYLSAYASYNFYHLVPLSIAFVALGGVTAVAFSQSLYYDSLAVAVLATGGGFLTPFLLSSSGSQAVGVIAYVLILDLGIIGIVLRKKAWLSLEVLSLVATYAVYLSWFLVSYHSNQLGTAAIALSLFWLVFYSLDVWHIRSGAPAFQRLRTLVASGNTVAYYGLMFILMFPSHRAIIGVVSLMIGAVYGSTILLLRRSLRDGDLVDVRFTLSGLTLLVIGTALLTASFITVVIWSFEAVALFWCGTRWNLRCIWQPALVLLGLAAVWLAGTANALAYEPIGGFVPVFNLRFLAFAVLAGGLAIDTALVRTLRDKYVQPIWTSLHSGWSGIAFIGLTVETNDVFRRTFVGASGTHLTALHYFRSLALAGVWTLLGLLFVRLGLRRRILPVLLCGLGCAVLGVVLGAWSGAAYQPVQSYTPALNLRAGLLVAIMGALYVHFRWLRDEVDAFPWLATVRIGFQAALILVGFELLTAEVNDYFARSAGHLTQTTHDVGLFSEFVALGITWMVYSLFLVWNGLRKSSQTLLAAGLGCSGVAIGSGLYCGFAAQPIDRLPFVLGTRAVMIPLLMLGLYLHLQWTKDARALYRWLDSVLVVFQAAIVVLGFELITGETRDFFDHAASTSASALTDSNQLRSLEQLTLSGLWLAYAIALMGIGLWRRTRWMRIGSMSLFGFIILKVFIYDLSFLQSLYRSISFVGLGVILLGVSYLYGRYRSLLLGA